MPFTSRWTVSIPNVSIPSLIFGPATEPHLTDRVAFADAEKPDTHYLTKSSWYLWSKRVAVGLQQAGLQEGDRVLLFSGNTLFFPVLFMGILFAEGIFTGANPTYVARELAHQLRDSGARFLFTADNNGSLETAIEAAAQAGLAKDSIFIFDDATFEGKGASRLGVRHWNDLVASEGQGKAFASRELESPMTTTACLNYSSGTTGVAKGVQISHYNYVANTMQVLHQATLDPEFERLNKEGRYLGILPMYHALGQSKYLMDAQLRDIPVFIQKKYDFIKMLENIEKFKISELIMVPPIVVAMAKHPATRKYDLSSVRKSVCGAAPLSREVSVEFESLWPDGSVNVKQAWGMTEVTCSVLGWDPRLRSDSSSVGELNANCSAKLMPLSSDTSITEITTPHTRGELYVHSPNTMLGYWRNPTATAAILTPDRKWLKTGDICFVDEQGHFTIVDRKKELIKVKGNQVAPAELEAVLLECEGVVDAAVVGVVVPGGGGEEVPRGYVVLDKVRGEGDTGVSEDERVARWVEGRVARFKRLVGGVVVVDSIPKNPSGKIVRNVLRERAAKEMAAASTGAGSTVKARL